MHHNSEPQNQQARYWCKGLLLFGDLLTIKMTAKKVGGSISQLKLRGITGGYIQNINDTNHFYNYLAISLFLVFGRICRTLKTLQSLHENGHETTFIHFTSNAGT